MIGTITGDTTYEVTFDVIQDLGTNGTNYSVRMLAFPAGAVHNDCRSNGTAIQLATKIGNSTTDGNFTKVTFQATVNAGDTAFGRDFTFRFIGSGGSALVDNVMVRTVSPFAGDQVPPAITSLTPADESVGVSPEASLSVTFDEDIMIGAGSYSGSSYQLVTFEYTSNGTTDTAVLGYDVALRFIGATTSANIDNVMVRVDAPAGLLDHFVISPIPSTQTVGTPITGITITALDADENTATDFTGTVTFGGTGGFSGTSGISVVTRNGGDLVLTFNCLNAASRGTAMLNVEHSSDLGISDAWTAAAVPETSGGAVSGVTFTVTPGSPLNGVEATISSTEAAFGKLFGRLTSQP